MLRYSSWGGITFSGGADTTGVAVAFGVGDCRAITGELCTCVKTLAVDFRLCIVMLFPWILSPLPLRAGGNS